MIFSKRHYEAIADTLRDECLPEHSAPVAMKLAKMFTADNPRFKDEQFYRACGL